MNLTPLHVLKKEPQREFGIRGRLLDIIFDKKISRFLLIFLKWRYLIFQMLGIQLSCFERKPRVILRLSFSIVLVHRLHSAHPPSFTCYPVVFAKSCNAKMAETTLESAGETSAEHNQGPIAVEYTDSSDEEHINDTSLQLEQEDPPPLPRKQVHWHYCPWVCNILFFRSYFYVFSKAETASISSSIFSMPMSICEWVA